MENEISPGRREVLVSLVKWSAAALSIGGLQGLLLGCGAGGESTPGPANAVPPADPVVLPYVDASNYANYFDYTNYSNYSNYINGPTPVYINYSDYSDYANYANYGDYFDQIGSYSDAYSDYLNYANYADYNDYSDYSNYSDYADYYDYSDYADYSDAPGQLAKFPHPKRLPAGSYADYADVYADVSLSPGKEGKPAAGTGRAHVARPPFRSTHKLRPKGGGESPRAATWVDLPEQPLSQVSPLPDPLAEASDLHGLAHQGKPEALQRPVRQKEGKRPRQLLGPGNKPQNQGGRGEGS